MISTGEQIDGKTCGHALEVLCLRGLSIWLDVPLPKGRRPQISEEEADALLAGLVGPNDLSKRAVSTAAKFDQKMIMSEKQEWTVSQIYWIGMHVTIPMLERVRDWLQEVINKLLRRKDAKLAPILPCLTDVISKQVWTNSEFKMTVSSMLRQHLRSKVILHPDDGRIPKISLACMWLLVNDAINEGASELHPHKRARLQKRVEGQTKKAAAAGGWAGFWDQYLIWEADKLDRKLPGWLDELPLMKSGLAVGPEVTAARTDWRNEAPGYAQALLGADI